MSQSFVLCPDCPDVIWYDDAKGQEQAVDKHRAMKHTQVSPEPKPADSGTDPLMEQSNV